MATYPSVNLTLVPGHDGGDVVLQHRGQGVFVGDSRHPGRELGVPDYIVSLSVSFGM
jgi:glyoxylase-like metal-dependent hydrolase (beta-lactamase superfamily II)